MVGALTVWVTVGSAAYLRVTIGTSPAPDAAGRYQRRVLLGSGETDAVWSEQRLAPSAHARQPGTDAIVWDGAGATLSRTWYGKIHG